MKWKLVAAVFGICLLFISYVISEPLGTLIGDNTDTAGAELITQFKYDIRDISQEYGYYDWENMDVLPGETEVVYFSQKDAAWASFYYDTRKRKTQTIRGGGCGPTSMAIVYSSLKHEVMNPGETAEWAMEHGYCAAPNGSYRSLFTTGAEELGLTNVYSGEDLETALGYLSEGKLIVALMGPGIFCDGGHFVVIRGITEEGKILIADCWNESNNDVEWEIGTIAENLKTDGANCLWVLGYEGSEDE